MKLAKLLKIRMNKKIAKLLIIIFLFCIPGIKGSDSYFSDSKTIGGNVFSTGNWTTPAPTIAPTLTPDPTATPTPTLTPTPTGTQLGDVVINEIMWMGSSASIADEWVELRNTTSNSIDMTGWILEGAASTAITIPSGIIPANGFFLISNYSETSSSSILNVSSDLVTTAIQLDNTGLQISLKNPSNSIIDTADDGSGVPFAGSNGTPKKSMERNSVPGNGTQASNWHTASSQVNLDPTASESATPKAVNSL
jgi:hypothetical protein